jgi:ubiquinone/menaquinone biosynthesis C-methylase UbiE
LSRLGVIIVPDMAKKYTVLETWIVNETKPVESNSAEQTFNRLETPPDGGLPFSDEVTDFRDEEHFREEAQIRDFASHLFGAGNVLDIGSGHGWPLLRLASVFTSVTGIDASTRRVKACAANAERLGLTNATVKYMSATELAFGDGTFDGATARNSFEQTPDPNQAMREVFRVLKPGAKLRVYFESYDRLDKALTEKVFLTDADETLGYHYVLQHRRPAWERSYLVKFEPTPEMRDEFRKLADLCDRLGGNPAQNPELGLQFLERNRERIAGASWYELEHFTSQTLKESLEEVGFVNVRVSWACATLAGEMWSRVKHADLTIEQMRDVLQGLADVTARLDAPVGIGEPVVATRPR